MASSPASSSDLLTARATPFIASAEKLVFVWGGHGDKQPEKVFIFRFDTKTWKGQLTKGQHPPAGLSDGGSTIAGNCLYLYGGWDGKDPHCDLYQFNFKSWVWRKICNGSARGPGMKTGCRMISYQDLLLVFGGYYNVRHSLRQAGSSYRGGWTNEVHSYNLTTGKSNVNSKGMN